MKSIVTLFSDSLKVKISLSELVSSHLLNRSRRTSITESIVKLFLDSLKLKISWSDLVLSHLLIGSEKHLLA
jgi:hypothetical protein